MNFSPLGSAIAACSSHEAASGDCAAFHFRRQGRWIVVPSVIWDTEEERGRERRFGTHDDGIVASRLGWHELAGMRRTLAFSVSRECKMPWLNQYAPMQAKEGISTRRTDGVACCVSCVRHGETSIGGVIVPQSLTRYCAGWPHTRASWAALQTAGETEARDHAENGDAGEHSFESELEDELQGMGWICGSGLVGAMRGNAECFVNREGIVLERQAKA